MRPRDERAAELYDYAAGRIEGFTNTEAMDYFGWTLHQFNDAVRVLRDIMADDDTIALVCVPGRMRADWIYNLVGRYEDMQSWAANRLLDAERRLKTIEHTTAPIARGLDGRSADGRKARLFNSTARYVKEQLELLDLGEAAGA